MKKLTYLLLLLIFVPVSLLASITGSGTWASPYTGTISSSADDFTISGTKYFNTIIVSGGGTLTISAGATLYASATTSKITITDTGILNAVGTSGNLITISADNNGINGHETGETWKNLTFELSTGTSVVDYAVIEYGTGNDDYSLGGGILVYANNVTISNSTICNCSVNGDGAGIYVYPTGTAVSLQNLVLHDNSATGNGGGLVIDGGDAVGTITGCDIYNNSASIGAGVYIFTSNSSTPSTITNSSIHNHASGEGICNNLSGSSMINCLIYSNYYGIYFNASGSATNCDIVNNTTGITTTTSSVSKIVNTVLWGNTTQYSVASGTLELANCGIQGGLSGGTDGGGNKTLSATNGADTGPNFVSTSSDFHINASISPLVDGGIGSYTGVTIPGSDKEGHTRISTLDIGAYEFVYYIWTGSIDTIWTKSGNWVGSPASVPTTITDNKVIIPNGCSKYPYINGGLSLSTRSVLTIQPGAGLRISGATSVGSGCTFNLKSDATGTANFISGSSVSGSFNVELFLTGGGNPNYKWHYVATPIDGYSKTALTTGINNTYNLLNYLESRVSTTREEGWNWHDGFSSTPGFSNLYTNLGYNVYTATDKTAIFTGLIRAGTDYANSSIYCGSGDAFLHGWNLIGNIFTSAVDANLFILTAKYVDKSIYFTQDNGYIYWNVKTQVGTASSGVVPALQGFFVHAKTGIGSNQVTIPASSRRYSANSLYKGSSSNNDAKGSHDFPYLKLNVTDGSAFTDESIVYFFNDATTTFDSDYDAYKMFSQNLVLPQIYSISDNTNMSINGLPFPDKTTIVPLNIRIGVANNYTINILNLENLDDYKVTLIHGTNRIDLKTNPSYTFSGSVGTITDMSVEFQSLLTDLNLPNENLTSCWYSNGVISIKSEQSGFDLNSSIIVCDINGRVILTKGNINLSKGETVQIPVNLPGGFYIANLINKNIKVVKKIIIPN